MNLPLQILERYWKFSKFRPQQHEIIQSVLNQQDCVALLPTGGGKSLCFQIPALINDGLCIVVSPLIALMQDQVNALNNKDIKATALTNLNHLSDLERILDNLISSMIGPTMRQGPHHARCIGHDQQFTWTSWHINGYTKFGSSLFCSSNILISRSK